MILGAPDLSASLHRFGQAVSTFVDALADIGWKPLAAALLLSLAMQLLRGNAWANALRAAYPGSRVPKIKVIGAFLVGAGLNGILPARGGDALKIVLAKRSVEASTYPTVISSFAVLAPFDSGMGILVLIYAITQGLLPSPPRLPHLPAFDVSFWATHPWLVGVLIGVLGIAIWLLARRADEAWDRLKQGLVILTQPARYLREVAAFQLVAWLIRFATFWLFLDAFHIGGSVHNVLLVMSVIAISGALPLTPGGVGSQQALLVATLHGASRTAVLSYSVGQQIAVTAFSAVISFLTLLTVFRITDWRRLVRESEAERGEEAAPT